MSLGTYDFALSGVARDAVPLTDATDATLPERVVGFRIGGAGDLSITTLAGNDRVIEGVGAGEYVPIAATHIKAATTATNVIAMIA